MSELKIPFLNELSPANPIFTASQLIASGAMIKIDKINWIEFSHLIEVKVFTGYDDRYLWLIFQVGSELIRAVCHADQEPVWQDSCVEFFIAQEGFYRNFEFNCLGVCLSASGSDRHSRKSLDKDSLEQILRFSSLTPETLPDENTPASWSLTVAIPLQLIGLKAGSEFQANFYKCGDETSVPHYLSWSPIETLNPDFHQPVYFGLVKLEDKV